MAILARVVDLKQSQASFSMHLTIWLYLAQMCISQDRAIFVPTTTDGTTSPLVHACGVITACVDDGAACIMIITTMQYYSVIKQ